MEPLTYDPTQEIIERVEGWCTKWKNEGQLSTEWENHIINRDATAAKNNPLYKTHKSGTPVRLLTSGCNSATEGLSTYVEKKCAPLAQNMRSRIRDTSHMLDIIDKLNEDGIPENAVLVSLDIENMFPSIDNTRGMETIRKRLDNEQDFPVPTDLIIEAIQIVLTSNNSRLELQQVRKTLAHTLTLPWSQLTMKYSMPWRLYSKKSTHTSAIATTVSYFG